MDGLASLILISDGGRLFANPASNRIPRNPGTVWGPPDMMSTLDGAGEGDHEREDVAREVA